MINTLDDYIWHSLPEYGDFETNRNLCKKVDKNGQILPFYGNTTVFLLDETTKNALSYIQRDLYDQAGWMLGSPLDPSIFHMTLHDLVNGPVRDQELLERMNRAEAQAKELLAQWRNQPPLQMRTTWLFNMVNTSIVLGLRPADEDSWSRLDEMYTALETVVPLGYGLTPHITMAYYRPGTWSQEDLWKLRNALRPVGLDVELNMDDLVFQVFEDMNHYTTK